MYKMMGFILTGGDNPNLKGLIQKRSVSSIPIGGRYRIIDFMLSNMVNSNIFNVGITTQYQFRSLMDHIGSGKEWDMDRRRDGLFIFPPFLTDEASSNWYRGSADAIYRNIEYLKRSKDEYVVIAPDDSIFKMNFQEVVPYHIEKNADITIVYKKTQEVALNTLGILELDENEKVIEFEQYPEHPKTNLASMGIYIMKRTYLLHLLDQYMYAGACDFVSDILIKNIADISMYGYAFTDYWRPINSIESYYRCNMDMLNPEYSLRLFRGKGPVYTKRKSFSPAYISPTASVKNSLITQGSKIEGNVEDSIIFRNVHIKEGASVKDAIVFQDAVIEKEAYLKNVIIEKGMLIKKGHIEGAEENIPIIGENTQWW